MSWTSKLWSATKWTAKHVLTLGLGYVVDRYVAKKAPKAVADALHGIIEGDAKRAVPELEGAMDALIRQRLDAALAAGRRPPSTPPRGKR